MAWLHVRYERELTANDGTRAWHVLHAFPASSRNKAERRIWPKGDNSVFVAATLTGLQKQGYFNICDYAGYPLFV